MTQSAAHASAFYREVAICKKVWTIKDSDGFPAPLGDGGKRTMPFWSAKGRAESIVQNVPAYKSFEIVQLNWVVFKDKWLVGLEKDGLNVGVNWSGEKAVGYDVEPETVRKSIESLIKNYQK